MRVANVGGCDECRSIVRFGVRSSTYSSNFYTRRHQQAWFHSGYNSHNAKPRHPLFRYLVWGAIALELGGGLMLVAGLYARWVALALFFYTFSLALIFHHYWTISDPAVARTDASSFFGHLSMMGGMLFVVAFGAGAYSVDALMARPSSGEVAARRLRGV